MSDMSDIAEALAGGDRVKATGRILLRHEREGLEKKLGYKVDVYDGRLLFGGESNDVDQH